MYTRVYVCVCVYMYHEEVNWGGLQGEKRLGMTKEILCNSVPITLENNYRYVGITQTDSLAGRRLLFRSILELFSWPASCGLFPELNIFFLHSAEETDLGDRRNSFP